jgi:hypothetical protein
MPVLFLLSRFRKLLQSRKVTFIHLGPNALYPMPALQTRFPIPPALLLPFTRQTLVDFPFDIVASSNAFPEEAARVAFVERIHDFFAPCVLCLLLETP